MVSKLEQYITNKETEFGAKASKLKNELNKYNSIMAISDTELRNRSNNSSRSKNPVYTSDLVTEGFRSDYVNRRLESLSEEEFVDMYKRAHYGIEGKISTENQVVLFDFAKKTGLQTMQVGTLVDIMKTYKLGFETLQPLLNNGYTPLQIHSMYGTRKEVSTRHWENEAYIPTLGSIAKFAKRFEDVDFEDTDSLQTKLNQLFDFYLGSKREDANSMIKKVITIADRENLYTLDDVLDYLENDENILDFKKSA